VLSVLSVGEVQGDAASAVAGDAGGDAVEVAADGGISGSGQGTGGEGPCGAQQVGGHRGDREPGGLFVSPARGCSSTPGASRRDGCQAARPARTRRREGPLP
jgi:hypothetical protein